MSFWSLSRAARVVAFGFVALLVSAPAFAACGAAPTAALTDSLLRLKNPAATTWSGAVEDAGSVVEGDFVYDGTNKVVAFCNGTAWVDVAAAGGSATLNGITAATGNQAGIANTGLSATLTAGKTYYCDILLYTTIGRQRRHQGRPQWRRRHRDFDYRRCVFLRRGGAENPDPRGGA